MGKLFSQFCSLLSPSGKIQLAALLGCMFLGALLEMVAIGVLFVIVGLFFTPDKLDCWIWGDWQLQISLPVAGCAAVVFYLSKNIYAALLIKWEAVFVYRNCAELEGRLFAKYLHAPYLFHLEHNSAELVNVIRQIPRIGEWIFLPMLLMASEFMVVVLVCLGLFALLGVTGGLAFAVLFVIGGMIYLAIRSVNYRLGRKQLALEKELLVRQQQSFAGIKEVKVRNVESTMLSDYRMMETPCYRNLAKLYFWWQLPRLTMECLVVVLGLVVLTILSLYAKEGSEVLLSAALFVLVMFRIQPSISRIQYHLSRIKQNNYSLDFIFRTLRDLPEEKVVSEALPISFEREITLENLGFRYNVDSEWLFQKFNLKVAKFEMLGISGVTGRGKSTLADLIMGILSPDEGEIKVDGVNIATNIAGWRRQIGLVPQQIYLLDRTIGENVAFGLPIDGEKIKKCLEMAQLGEFTASIGCMVGENGMRISGGQRQRLGIARALYADASLLVLDEPTSSLDVATEEAFAAELKNLRGKVTVILISHRAKTLEYCDRIVEI